MNAKILGVTGWTLEQHGGYWHHVNDELRLMTTGWLNHCIAIKYADNYRDDAGTRKLMGERYEEYKGTKP